MKPGILLAVILVVGCDALSERKPTHRNGVTIETNSYTFEDESASVVMTTTINLEIMRNKGAVTIGTQDESVLTIVHTEEDTVTMVTMKEGLVSMATTAEFLTVYLTPVVVGFGFLGNLGCLCVLQHRGMRRSTGRLLLSTQAGADSLLTGLLLLPYLCGHRHYYTIPGTGLLHPDTSCAVFNFLHFVLRMVSNWNLALVAAERSFNLWGPETLRARHVWAAWGLMLAAVIAMNAHVFWSVETLQARGSSVGGELELYGECKVSEGWEKFVHDIWGNAVPWVYAIIPSLIIILSCILVIWGLRRIPERLKSNVDEMSFTLNMISIAACYILTHIPLCVMLALTAVYDSNTGSVADMDIMETHYNLVLIGEVISFFNPSLNIFLYYLSGSTFRRYFWEVVRRAFHCCPWRTGEVPDPECRVEGRSPGGEEGHTVVMEEDRDAMTQTEVTQEVTESRNCSSLVDLTTISGIKSNLVKTGSKDGTSPKKSVSFRL